MLDSSNGVLARRLRFSSITGSSLRSAVGIAACTGLIVVSGASLVEARTIEGSAEAQQLGHVSVPRAAARPAAPGSYKVAAKLGGFFKGAASAAGTAARRNRDKKEQEGEASGNDTGAEQSTDLGGPQKIDVPPTATDAAPAVSSSPAAKAAAPAVAPAGIQSLTGNATAGSQFTCVANCIAPPPARRNAAAPARPAGSLTKATASAQPAATGGLTCVAGCGDGLPRAAAVSPAAGSELKPTTSEGNGRITVMRGVTRAKVYGVSR